MCNQRHLHEFLCINVVCHLNQHHHLKHHLNLIIISISSSKTPSSHHLHILIFTPPPSYSPHQYPIHITSSPTDHHHHLQCHFASHLRYVFFDRKSTQNHFCNISSCKHPFRPNIIILLVHIISL